MTNERRRSQRLAVKMMVDLMLADGNGETFAGPVQAELNSFSHHGGCVVLPSMHADGMHLFYACNPPDGRFLKLRFADSSGRYYTISCRPVWFDKEIDEAPAYYKLGFEFTRAEDSRSIKLLDRMVRGKSEKSLIETIGDFLTSEKKDRP